MVLFIVLYSQFEYQETFARKKHFAEGLRKGEGTKLNVYGGVKLYE